MATFRVEQRVRIKFCLHKPDYSGMETTITGPLEICRRGLFGKTWLGYAVAIDPLFFPQADQLEPIQPERNRIVAWEELALPFDPRKVGETV